MNLRIFNSQRQIKAYLAKAKEKNILLDRLMLDNEFIENICEIDLFRANTYECLLLLQKACLKSKDLSKKLGISNEFFAFLKSHTYLFSFFKELAIENKSVDDLKSNDYYASYIEHLEILDEVFKNYLANLKENKLFDDISLCKEYSLNVDFLQQYDLIIYNMQGFLNYFMSNLLEQISKHKRVILCFRTSKFNMDALKKLSFLNDIEFKLNVYYEIDISSKEILRKQECINKNKELNLKSFDLRTLQATFVQDELSNFIAKGVDPQDIIIITPDESFCELLHLYDKNNNLNFASGFKLSNTLFYQALQALFESVKLIKYEQDKDYFKNASFFDYQHSILNILDFNTEFINTFKVKFKQDCDFVFLEKILNDLAKNESNELKEYIKKELYLIKELLNSYTLSLETILELLFISFNKLSLSHTSGGKVTVAGLLESRGLSFKGVIIVDFNDEFVPTRDINELFLNNEIRKKAGLISYETRENLQRFYYENLIKNAEFVSISYIQNDEFTKSRFLDELDIKANFKDDISNEAYLNALNLNYESVILNLTPLNAPIMWHDIFKNPLSFSRLNCFLKCKRTYYYKYILNLQEARSFGQDDKKALKMGNFVHDLLEKFYTNSSKDYFDERAFFEFFKEHSKELNALDRAMLKIRLKNFAQKEKEHFENGYKIKALELNFNSSNVKIYKIADREIKLEGKIDRIDELNGKNLIIDYKYGNVKNYQDSYQLAFYKALYDRNADGIFYDLINVKFDTAKNKSLLELEECLKELLKNQFIEFDSKGNLYCPYKLIYEKDFK
ncbi:MULTISPECIES: PD-(D/E)XK nuclease family protein [unclassified Campylobacter]|uniref:PD-(D/E)XK nuclease family protein n=1 Tax=unclassified Campylobacter TaxID=2593542 RepID=UPI0012380CBD|nr:MULTISPECIES: PD-(D/E)XK nuclease family protein [unclassified Campylobacter]KAA6224605.1 hypothetical protein FMM54_08120 [Campylobacter sp. LR185c]KAA6224847.1 hypothetical protein FMM57_08395 [Campylobacter sp. LR286c]KAA6227994.1 hypothetical protein FMM55_02165 [Campylobacter sp. LR196d]KAA6234412.1 hypothetical protein FMM56_00795 [Campylobacter sp. LR264d]KAA8603531.1 hypothetical protein CGP82_06795 [Campylobacter sp. LR185c]